MLHAFVVGFIHWLPVDTADVYLFIWTMIADINE